MSVFGEIAKNVGKDVAEGLAKNVEPIVKKAAKKITNTVDNSQSAKEFDAETRRLLDKSDNHLGRYYNSEGGSDHDNIHYNNYYKSLDTIKKHLKSAVPSIENYSITKSDVNEFGMKDPFYTLADFSDISSLTKDLTPEIKTNFNNILMITKYNPKLALEHAKNIVDLTPNQQKEYITLLPEWQGTIKDLKDVVRLI
jgi:hypothetical protein